ncbi:MAG: SycD/LcrH family type III secretion system chaperone [Chlamydiia bacterium]|nr:SycD/LcrH family type III secretion system chaperone [Chlamydiia bacterium]
MINKSFLSTIDPNNKEQIKELSFKIINKIKKEGGTVAAAMGLSEEFLEEIYQLAYTYYNQGKNKEAISLFYVLMGVSPKNFKYVLGLAAAYYQLEDYYHAALGFTLAFSLDPKNPLSAYYASDSLLKLNQVKEALEVLDKAIDLCGSRIEHAELKERCVLIRKSFEDKQS